jgi:hypothetical protein
VLLALALGVEERLAVSVAMVVGCHIRGLAQASQCDLAPGLVWDIVARAEEGSSAEAHQSWEGPDRRVVALVEEGSAALELDSRFLAVL